MALSYKIKFEGVYKFLQVKNYDIIFLRQFLQVKNYDMFLRQSKLAAINWLKEHEMITNPKKISSYGSR